MKLERDADLTMSLQDFWSRVRLSRNTLLALDYDGTLAPFHANPMKAFPLPGVIDAIRRLKEAPGVTVTVISGRPVHELSSLLGNIGVHLIGCHGFESMDPDGNITLTSLTSRQIVGIETAAIVLSSIGSRAWMEKKMAGVALHTRRMRPAEAQTLEEQVFEQWTVLAFRWDLECRRFNGGIEIRARGRHKGTALTELLAGQPERTLVVYIGDDETDEDAFRAVLGHGIGIRVGQPASGSFATELLQDCRAVKDFLDQWVKITASGKESSERWKRVDW